MPRLIINADDLGAGTETDRGICDAFCRGIVTSASLLVTGVSARSAATTARDCGLPLGIHLNLSEGEPLSGAIPGLTEADGGFAGKQKTRQRLALGEFDRTALRKEIRAQIETALDWGVTPDHLDSHQHVFLFPGVTEAIIEAVETYRIGAARLPLPRPIPGLPPTPELQAELALYRQLAPGAEEKLRVAGVASPTGLFGLEYLNRLNTPHLHELLAAIPAEGVWELMVHPGHLDPDNPFSGSERELEWQALTAPAIRARVNQLGIELINYGELPCAS